LDDAAADIEGLMAVARQARSAEDLARADEALLAAWMRAEALPDDHPLRAVVGWRRVKVAFDRGDMPALLQAMDAVTGELHPFDASSAALRGAEPVARRLWDAAGYGLPCMERMWVAYTKTWRDAGDPWMAACGETQLAWEWACSGRLDEVGQLLERTARLDPRSFGTGPSRHPLAADAPTSVWFAQMDHARVALQGAVWGCEEGLARVAAELYADALADAELNEDDDIWFLEGVGRAEVRFDWPRTVAPRWHKRAATASHPRVAFHGALAQAVLAPTRDSLADLVGHFDAADAYGPEWGVDARIEAALLGDRLETGDVDRWRADAMERARTYGLGVFSRG
jgi:hypothetical protein